MNAVSSYGSKYDFWWQDLECHHVPGNFKSIAWRVEKLVHKKLLQFGCKRLPLACRTWRNNRSVELFSPPDGMSWRFLQVYARSVIIETIKYETSMIEAAKSCWEDQQRNNAMVAAEADRSKPI